MPEPPAMVEDDILNYSALRGDESSYFPADSDSESEEMEVDLDDPLPSSIDDMEFDVSDHFSDVDDVHEDTMEEDFDFDIGDFSGLAEAADPDFDDPEFPVNSASQPPAFEVLKGGTERGKDLLLDNVGYTYCIKVNIDFQIYFCI